MKTMKLIVYSIGTIYISVGDGEKVYFQSKFCLSPKLVQHLRKDSFNKFMVDLEYKVGSLV